MKKLLALSLSMGLMVASFAGCGKSAQDAPKEKLTAKVIEVNLTEEEYAFGVDKAQPELLASTNEFIKQIMSDGTYDEICNKYFGDGTPTPVESATFDASKDQLVIATNAAFAPFEYMQGSSYVGIDMEIAKLLADHLGMELVIENMDFDAVCLSVGQHKADIAMSGLTVKEDRKEYVDFTDTYYVASQKLIVLSTDTEFDACQDAASVEAILNSKDKLSKIGVQTGTTGQFYCEGDADWGFTGLPLTTVGYKNGSLAVQDLLNGNINYVIIDAAPAKFITEAINSVQ
ncbi:MAG: transporter substrate-binding domain-containing protein [Lachnospiraceae bacterium]|nr:transporter substrate-binding domain-containing protein [Lachnospiraceae bacterium]